MNLRNRLLDRARSTYPYPPNPFCSPNVTVNTVREILEEAGYKDFTLYVHPNGIYIERKNDDSN